MDVSLIEGLRHATVYDLEQPRFFGMPIHPAHKPGYLYSLHRRHRDNYQPERYGPRSGASGLPVMMEHSGTQITPPLVPTPNQIRAWRPIFGGSVDILTGISALRSAACR